ncbi:MAG: hypothetical protein V2I43_15410, partial [Parvularcula sp.]|nr:hypothetical protein [Parvularcula sp.]
TKKKPGGETLKDQMSAPRRRLNAVEEAVYAKAHRAAQDLFYPPLHFFRVPLCKSPYKPRLAWITRW